MAKKLHKVDVDVKLLQGQDHDHGQFLIQEKFSQEQRENEESQEVDHLLSNGLNSFKSISAQQNKQIILINSPENLIEALLPSFPVPRAVRSAFGHQAGGQLAQENPTGQHYARMQNQRHSPHGSYNASRYF